MAGMDNKEEIFSKVLRAGRRTYFFDVRETRAGDYYLTITESKKNQNDDGSYFFKKHKIYLYKEDFEEFMQGINEATQFIIDEKGQEVISERHQKDFTNHQQDTTDQQSQSTSFDGVDFDEI